MSYDCFIFSLNTMQPLAKRGSSVGKTIAPQSTLPHYRHSPTSVEQPLLRLPVAFDVRAELRLPELSPCGWLRCISTSRMLVPETAMDEADRAKSSKGKIWSTGELCVEPESDSVGVQATAEEHFGLRVLAADVCHHPRAGSLVDDVCHQPLGMSTLRIVAIALVRCPPARSQVHAGGQDDEYCFATMLPEILIGSWVTTS